jgi:hypothetical protein
MASRSEPEDETSTGAKRIVLNNLAREQALQINAPIGTKGWKETEKLVIEKNVATGSAIQVNHAISDEVLDLLLEAHRKTTGAQIESERGGGE